MYRYIPRFFLPCTVCFTLLSGGLCLGPVVQTPQAAQDITTTGKLYAESIDDYSRTHNRGYDANKRYKKNDPSRLHDNRYHEKNSQYNQGRGKGAKRGDSYDRNDRDRRYDGKRGDSYDRNDRDRRYDGKRGDNYDRNDRDRRYDGKRDNNYDRDGRDRRYDGRDKGSRRDGTRQAPTDEPALN